MIRAHFPTPPGVVTTRRLIGCLAALLIATTNWSCRPDQAEDDADANGFQVPVAYHQLDNGLKVVLSPDHTAPLVTVAAYYHIGFRNEPKGRTGFAHLFEHLMFQGSRNLGKLEFIRLVQKNGGALNGSTRLDFTNYYATVPQHKLETMLWAEADRMRSLVISEENLVNQQGVVKNEVKLNVTNRPYGGFPWLDLPQAAFTNWYNAHNFYGDLEDLDAATLDDARAFFDAYYAPNNAAIVVVGDFEEAQALEWVKKYFGDIAAVDIAAKPDVSEPPQTEERRRSRVDPLVPRPALAMAYRMPERGSPDLAALAVLDEILVQGDDSLMHRRLVQEEGVTSDVSGGINSPLGTRWNVEGPSLWSMSLVHDLETPSDAIVDSVDSVIDEVQQRGVDQRTFDRALVQLRSDLYDNLTGIDRADMLAAFALYDDDPERINGLEAQLLEVTPEQVKAVAKTYFSATNRTIFELRTQEQGAADDQGAADNQGEAARADIQDAASTEENS